jgi:hypothetical protein
MLGWVVVLVLVVDVADADVPPVLCLPAPAVPSLALPLFLLVLVEDVNQPTAVDVMTLPKLRGAGGGFEGLILWCWGGGSFVCGVCAACRNAAL